MEVVVVKNLEKKERIDKYLNKETELSRSLISKMIKSGFILVNEEEIKPNYMVKNNDVISIDESFTEEVNIEKENIELDIVYEDEDLIVVNKPSGMVVHPGNGNKSGTLVNALMYHTNLSDLNGEIRPGIVHRIDKDTSGLMIVAKTNKVHEILADMFQKKEVKREYIALLKGVLKEQTNTIDAPIGRDKIDRKKMTVTTDNSKSAITHMQVLKRYKNYTLVKCILETGRTHQIRVHAKYINHPIFNDPVYTNDSVTEFGQFLHSASLDFIHPITKKHLHFECPLPQEFQDKLNELETIV